MRVLGLSKISRLLKLLKLLRHIHSPALKRAVCYNINKTEIAFILQAIKVR